MKEFLVKVEQAGFTNLRSWRAHWDRQLYKALEHQYQVGLEALNEHLPEIQVHFCVQTHLISLSRWILSFGNSSSSSVRRWRRSA